LIWLPVALFAASSSWYAGPLLVARSTTLSPPVQAALWAERELPPRTVILVEGPLAPHASYLLRTFRQLPVETGLERLADRPGVPLALFGDGESGWEGAAVFRWPASDAYCKLTRCHYRIVSVSPIPADRRYWAVRGVHAFEPSVRQARWRWLDADAALRLYPRGARAVTLTLGLPPGAPWPSNSVAVSVDGRPVGTVEVARAAAATTVLPLPEGPDVEVELRSGASFIPAATGVGTDTRRLAVQLLSLELEPPS
jgi:hypothetical protein